MRSEKRDDPRASRRGRRSLWGALLAIWAVSLCVVPDPRPLSAPDRAVDATESLLGIATAEARLVATIALRAGGLFVLGALVALASGARRRPIQLVFVPVIAAALGLATLWINYGYFPIPLQLRIGACSVIFGAWSGFAIARSLVATVVLVLAGAGLFSWGLATGISDDLDATARITARDLLDVAETMPSADAGFSASIKRAFRTAAANTRGDDPVHANRAAILALGVVLGEAGVAQVAKREVDVRRMRQAGKLRARVTLRGREDWSRHFWVSAGLTVLSDENRTMAVGLLKELMDATPGGSGFSFTDLTADRAGYLFAVAATRDESSARAMQERLRKRLRSSDFLPSMEGIPGNMSRDRLHGELGGLNGEGTTRIVEEIQRRLADCAALR